MKLIDLTGQKFGKLLVMGRNYEKQSKYVHWNCLGDCGNVSVVDGQNLKSGHTKSCGHCERFVKLDDDVMKCVLPDGRFFIFDTADIDLVRQHKWTVASNGYVETTTYDRGVTGRLRLHRLLLDIPKGMFVDHINGNRWDNRRSNLRPATPEDNAHNHKLIKTNTSGYNGVSFDKRRERYEAYICVKRIKKHLGYFDDPVTAARAYDQAAIFYYGEFAKLNLKEEANGEVLEVEKA